MKSPALALVLLALTLALVAEAQGTVRVTPAAESFHLGALELVALRDAGFVVPNDGKTFGLGASPTAVAAVLKSAGAPTDKVSLSVDALLVKAPGRLILIDTGLGPKVGGVLLASLAKAGVPPGAVTDVLITHSHGDHIGGLLSASGGLAFPNATIRMSSREWGWLQTQSDSAEIVKVLTPKVKPFMPGMAIAPGVTPIGLGGHTPGHVGYEIVSGSARLLDIGDTAHSSIISLAKPGWNIEFDNDLVAGRLNRTTTLTLLAKSQEMVFAPHFPFPGVGRIEKAGDGFTWKPGVK